MLHLAELSRTALRAGICCVLLLSVGCAGRGVSPFAGLDAQQARTLAQKLEKTRDAELQADLQSAFATHAPQNILILSGGDADGAFGCGVLCGWREASGGRPVFDVVTGVSTRALMATFAFLGQAQDDALLRDVYTHLHDKDVMGGLFAPAPPDSVFDTSPLRRLIARYVTPDALRRLAAAHREGRRLYVATVELDSGALVIWPLSKIAADAVAPATPSMQGDSFVFFAVEDENGGQGFKVADAGPGQAAEILDDSFDARVGGRIGEGEKSAQRKADQAKVIRIDIFHGGQMRRGIGELSEPRWEVLEVGGGVADLGPGALEIMRKSDDISVLGR